MLSRRKDKLPLIENSTAVGRQLHVGQEVLLKRIFFLALSWTGINALFSFVNRGKVKTLIYHNVLSQFGAFKFALSPEEFERHLIMLKRKYNPVALTPGGAIVGLRNNRINVLLTFDDGFANNYEFVFPILVKHNFMASFFVLVNFIETGCSSAIANLYSGKDNTYDINDAVYRTLSIAQIQEMAAAGMTFGSHTFDHTSLSKHSFQEGLAIARESRN